MLTSRKRLGGGAAVVLTLLLAVSPAEAFIFSEHARIMQDAVDAIRGDPSTTDAMRSVLERNAKRAVFCANPTSDCLDLVYILPALAGDHSCSPRELRSFVDDADKTITKRRKRHWITDVLDVVRRTDKELEEAGDDPIARTLLRRQSNVDLQYADADYVPRATVDYSHFQLSRESGALSLIDYLRTSFTPGREANATAAYANYHVAAIRLAARVHGAANPAVRDDLWTRALMAEAFAVHFLEDSFSSGHIVGHWGSEGIRLGTHDHYCAAGIEAQRWVTLDAQRDAYKPICDGPVPHEPDPPCVDEARRNEARRLASEAPYRARGDAFLSTIDRTYAAGAVRKSLVHVLRAATEPSYAQEILRKVHGALGIEDYDSCNDRLAPPGLLALAARGPVYDVLAEEPIPSPAEPAPLRIRAEKGIFFGGAVSGDAGHASIVSTDGFLPSGPGAANLRARATVRFGYGGGDLTDDSLNGQAFGDVGIVALLDDVFTPKHETAVGFTFRVRAPGHVFFLDGLLAVLLAETTRNPRFIDWAALAGTGGFRKIWASHQLFGNVVGQFSFLRDVAVNWFPNEPSAGGYRVDVLAPVFTARYALPIAGDGWSQSTDAWFDVGLTATTSKSYAPPSFGFFLALSSAGRVFPP
ncbi:MAG TPA: hypothetical protein VM925_34955 [Labilithrix sp.]|nr:hypothetical protein [Labilithrix sp.]